jgi:hypothetical protein
MGFLCPEPGHCTCHTVKWASDLGGCRSGALRRCPAASGQIRWFAAVRAEVVRKFSRVNRPRSSRAPTAERARRALRRSEQRRVDPLLDQRPLAGRQLCRVDYPALPAVAARGPPPLQQEARSSHTSIRGRDDPAVPGGAGRRGGGAESRPLGHGQTATPLAVHASRHAHQHRTDSHTCSTQAATRGRGVARPLLAESPNRTDTRNCGAGQRPNARPRFVAGSEAGSPRNGSPVPALPQVPANDLGGHAQRLASLGIPVLLPHNGLVDRLVAARHVC